MSKGSKRRPCKIDTETFAENWDRALGLHGNDSTERPMCKGEDAGSIPASSTDSIAELIVLLALAESILERISELMPTDEVVH